jgi:choline monooxygenase
VRIDGSESTVSLDAFLSDVVSRLSTVDVQSMNTRVRRDYQIECNWKVYVDNYLEG